MRIREGTGVTCKEQYDFRRGRSCVDKVFGVRQVCKKFEAKGKEVFRTFMDFKNVYDMNDMDGLWYVL